MTLDEMIANGMDPNTEVEIPLTLEQIDLLIKNTSTVCEIAAAVGRLHFTFSASWFFTRPFMSFE